MCFPPLKVALILGLSATAKNIFVCVCEADTQNKKEKNPTFWIICFLEQVVLDRDTQTFFSKNNAAAWVCGFGDGGGGGSIVGVANSLHV